MKKNKSLLIIILVFTIVIIGLIIITGHKSRFNDYVVSDVEFENILDGRRDSESLILKSIFFNDYKLIIDESNSKVYYSIVDSRKQFNPSIEYTTNSKDVKIAIDSEISKDYIDSHIIKIVIYNKDYYRKYLLVVTDYPTINVIGNNIVDMEEKMIPVDIDVFDNHIRSPRKIINTKAEIKKVSNEKYYLKLKRESPGHNIRKNPLSLFGMDREHEYDLVSASRTSDNYKYVQLFINGVNKGIYNIEPHFEEN